MNRIRVSKAFTLIELLVVIAIIAILAAILFPVFAQAKKSAKIATTLSNMKQVVLANKMYANDNNDYYAMSTNGWPLPAGVETIAHLQIIYPYTHSIGVHWSGLNPAPGNMPGNTTPPAGHQSWGAWTFWTTISCNAVALNHWNGPAYKIEPHSESDYDEISALMMYSPIRTEAGPGIGTSEFDPFWETCVPDEQPWWWLYNGYKDHNKSVISGYADGHVGNKKSNVFVFLPGSTDPWSDPACVRFRQTKDSNYFYGWYLNGEIPIY